MSPSLLLHFVAFPCVVCVLAALARDADDQTVIRIDGGSRQDTVQAAPSNETRPLAPTAHVTLTKWTPWSKCRACRQHRSTQRISSTSLAAHAKAFEERPCRRRVCLRLWHKRRCRRRMRLVLMHPKQGPRAKTFKYFDNNRKKSRVWSKWSTWSKCSKTCRAERYKVCRKPGRCLKRKKYESALCYYPNTLCERSVLHHLGQYNLPDRPDDAPTSAKGTASERAGAAQAVHADAATLGTGTAGSVSRSAPSYKQQCGRPLRKHPMLKIKGGRDASRGMWPWHVAVINQHDEPFCSGTLIAPKWVLTAAHCIRANLKVRLNEFDLWQPDGEIEVPVERDIRHYGFNEKSIDNDIGLLYMARPVKTPVACLPTAQPGVEMAHRCTVLGWGATDASTDNGGYHILQQAKLPIVHWGKCLTAYADYYITPNMFCAGYPNGKADTCAGDSGGGLVCKTWRTDPHTRQRKLSGYVIQGITSFGDACGKPNRYGVYTNVTNYLEWIHYTMAMVVRQQRYHHGQRHSRPHQYHHHQRTLQHHRYRNQV